MLDEPATQPSSLKARLQELWRRGDRVRFFALVEEDRIRFLALVEEELRPSLAALLRRKFKFCQDDIEESISCALEGLLDRPADADAIDNVQAYLIESVKNAAKDIIRQREKAGAVVREQTQQLESASRRRGRRGTATSEGERLAGRTRFDPTLTVLVLDAVLGETDANPSWAGTVLEVALLRLPPRQRDAIKVVLIYGPEFDAGEAAELLGIKDAHTYRSTKHRAYKKLERIVPEVMRELEVSTSKIGISPLFEESHEVGADLTGHDSSHDSSHEAKDT